MNPVFKHTADPQVSADFISEKIIKNLSEGNRVLWLIPGGSSITVAVLASKKIKEIDHTNLVVTLTDERFGEIDHKDSNWFQLKEAGFDLPHAMLLPVLTGEDLLTTTSRYASNLKKELEKADYNIGLFGIGADGHTAGILPHTEALNSEDVAHAYDAGQFTRITMTFPAIVRLNEAVVFAQGKSKWLILEKLTYDESLSDQPAQILKRVEILTIFSDYSN